MTFADLAKVSEHTLAAVLIAKGYTVTRAEDTRFDDHGWEKPAEFSRRHGYHSNWLSAQMCKGVTLPAFERHLSRDRKRLIRLRSNEALEEFAKRK